MNRAAPFALTGYDVDVFAGDLVLDVETATRSFDEQGRLASITATTFDATPPAANVEAWVSYSYTPNGLLATRTVEDDRAGALAPTDRVSLTYDGERVTSFTEATFVNGAFVADRRETYEYDGDRLRQVTYEERGLEGLVASSRDLFSYGGNPFPDQIVEQTFEDGAFVNEVRTRFSEVVGADVVVLEERWDGSAWQSSSRTTYSEATLAEFAAAFETFSTGALPDATPYGFAVSFTAFTSNIARTSFYDAALSETWTGSTWLTTSRSLIVREAGRVTEITRQQWDGAAWTNTFRSVYAYDAAGLASSFANQEWTGSDWRDAVAFSFDYDADGNMTKVLLEAFDFATSTLVPFERTSYSWTDLAVADENDIPTSATGLTLAGPNPFSDRTALSFTLAAPADVSVTVYDMLGRAVATLADEAMAPGTHRVDLDGHDLPAGVYVVRLATAEGTAIQPVTLVR
ncbi:MAG: T9SS type A sorting domain-containing protein [Bacteroidota bacterium]